MSLYRNLEDVACASHVDLFNYVRLLESSIEANKVNLRDQLAMAASYDEIIEYLPSAIVDVCKYVGVEFKGIESYTNDVKLKAYAKARYEFADEMLKAREE